MPTSFDNGGISRGIPRKRSYFNLNSTRLSFKFSLLGGARVFGPTMKTLSGSTCPDLRIASFTFMDLWLARSLRSSSLTSSVGEHQFFHFRSGDIFCYPQGILGFWKLFFLVGQFQIFLVLGRFDLDLINGDGRLPFLQTSPSTSGPSVFSGRRPALTLPCPSRDRHSLRYRV